MTVLTIFMCSIPFLINEKGIKTLGNAKSESWVETNKVKTFTKMKKDIKEFNMWYLYCKTYNAYKTLDKNV